MSDILSSPSAVPPASTVDDCPICLSTLAPGNPLVTLSCNHKFHLQCLASNIQAQNKECPLCRTTIDASVVQLLSGSVPPPAAQQPVAPIQAAQAIPSTEDLVDEIAVRALSERLIAARRAASQLSSEIDHFPMITAETTLEYGAQASNEESNIYGLITLQAPPLVRGEDGSTGVTHIPMDLVCVVDQSGSMQGAKIDLLKQTLVHIVEQMTELDRLAIISFETTAYDRSHGLKRMNQQNQQILKNAIESDIRSGGGTYIGTGLQMGIDLLRQRQTKNPLGAILLLTDGQDNEQHDYTPLMQTLPEGVQCHTFGYGPDHTATLLVQLAQQGNGGTFTYIDEENAVGSAFAMALGGLFTCVAEQIQVQLEFSGEYGVTHFHSNYKYTPEQLPSNKLSIQLHNLNADEKRNLLFQLHVPRTVVEQDVEMASQQPMSQEQPSADAQMVDDQPIGHVTITYMEPNSARSITTVPVSFKLIRMAHPSEQLLVVNHVLDRQRNRIETAQALERAMEENNFNRSRAILKAQVEKIRASVSAQDPLCQELVRDLEYIYPTERAYRSSHHNTYMCHQTERGTYIPASTTSSERYNTNHQRQLAARLRNKNC